MLKQDSSLTNWSRIVPYYRDFVAEIRSVLTAIEDADAEQRSLLDESDVLTAMKCLAAMEDAIERLRQGDRTVFRFAGYGTGDAYFCEAIRLLDTWQGWDNREWHSYRPIADSAFWPALERARSRLAAALGNTQYILEPRHTDVPAPLADMRELRPETSDSLVDYFGPIMRMANLPDVPTPSEEVLIPTGDEAPCSGIYEPVKAAWSKGVLTLFRRPVPDPDGQYELDGCMNYLHGGSPAPTIGFEDDDERGEGRKTVWRLLWADDRYTDGVVPEEEQTYHFVHPTELKATRVAGGASAAGATPVMARAEISAGQPCPRTGWWRTAARLGERRHVEMGEPMPEIQSRTHGVIIWYFDDDQRDTP
ncbi:hypothetical protein IP84_14005 [beta proteobacterium AAP99]|nr:hypothetical protein IP84_14005 [beta proteobacterium AAP99]